MKQRLAALCSIGGCITLKGPSNILEQWWAIRQELKVASPKHFHLRRYHISPVYILWMNTMSMLLQYVTMWMTILLPVTSKCFNGEAQLPVVAARPAIIPKKNERLLCSTCIPIWKRWNHISCKCSPYYSGP